MRIKDKGSLKFDICDQKVSSSGPVKMDVAPRKHMYSKIFKKACTIKIPDC